MKDYKIRPYKEGDEVNINNAFNKVFKQNRTLEEWYWKFKPEKDGYAISVAVDNQGKVLAHYAGIKVLMQIDGNEGIYIHSLDNFSLRTRDVLRKRLFLKTFKEYIQNYAGPWPEKYPWHYGSGGGRQIQLGILKEGMCTPVPIIYLFKKTKIFKRVLGMCIRGFAWKWYTKQRSFELKEIDDLWNRSSHRYDVSLVRNGNYINGRYLTNPARNYIYLSVKNNGRIEAMAVLSSYNNCLQWLELIWDGQNSESLKKLEKRVQDVAFLLGAANVEMWLNNDEDAKNVLLSQGMQIKENPYNYFIVSGTYVPEIDGYDLTKRLYFTMGDSDLF
ncbi:MAG: hypothetical protein DHS20C13_06530 [Thermodesulfobacteriota bacterium]|nr:MAG: hypothetical protein DHS20C13_06530 [Thermodesulfobacteriota bacterium]